MLIESTKREKFSKNVKIVLGLTIFLLMIIVGGIFWFLNANRMRILEQNKSYLEEATGQKAELVKVAINIRIGDIRKFAHLYSDIFEADDIYTERLKTLDDNELFDYVYFIDANGICHTDERQEIDCSDKEYFTDGMNGGTGTELIISETNGEKLLGCYTPVYQEDEIIGVLIGFTGKEKLSSMLESSFYGTLANVFLVNSEGSIAGYSTAHEVIGVDTIFQVVSFAEYITDGDYDNLMSCLKNGDSCTIQYIGTSGVETFARISNIGDTQWFLFETFPSSVEQRLIKEANKLAEALMFVILFVVFIYIIVVLYAVYANRKKEIALEEQKRKEESLIRISNTDELTGVLNRRAYVKAISGESITSNYVFMSIDLNGLKQVNDNMGHDIGDELIIGAATCMKKCFGKYGKIYRVGGDEFIAIISASMKEFKKLKANFDDTVRAWSGESVDSLSLAVGIVSKEEFPEMNIKEIAKLADERMYVEKDKYYNRMGIERRR